MSEAKDKKFEKEFLKVVSEKVFVKLFSKAPYGSCWLMWKQLLTNVGTIILEYLICISVS